MPTYSFRNINTGEVFDKFMSMGAKDGYLSDNPDLESIMGAPSLVYSPTGKKPDDGFRDLLRKVKSGSGRRNSINTF